MNQHLKCSIPRLNFIGLLCPVKMIKGYLPYMDMATILYIASTFHSPTLISLHMELEFYWPSVFQWVFLCFFVCVFILFIYSFLLYQVG